MKAHHIILLLVIGLFTTMVAQAEDFVLVANKNVKVGRLSRQDVKELLLGMQANWPDGVLVHVAVQAGQPLHEKVVRSFANMTPYQFDRYWKRLVFAGNGIMPDAFRSDTEMLAFVAGTQGAIGYVSAGADTSSVKILAID